MTLPLGYRYAATLCRDTKRFPRRRWPDLFGPACRRRRSFTTNVVQAAPVTLARKHLRASGGKVAAILVNAGNANCATRTGDAVALASAKAVAKALKTKTKYVLPASTGVIGVELDRKLLTNAVPKLVTALSPINFEGVAKAMMTTDLRMKTAFEVVNFRGGSVRVAGMTKGSGMIHPNMATTLGFVLTDAVVPSKVLGRILTAATAGATTRSPSTETCPRMMSSPFLRTAPRK